MHDKLSGQCLEYLPLMLTTEQPKHTWVKTLFLCNLIQVLPGLCNTLYLNLYLKWKRTGIAAFFGVNVLIGIICLYITSVQSYIFITKHTHVISTQMKAQNITSIPDTPCAPSHSLFCSSPLVNFVSEFQQHILSLPALNLL